jgi:hypothetical protein
MINPIAHAKEDQGKGQVKNVLRGSKKEWTSPGT